MDKRVIEKGAIWIGILSIVLGLAFLALSIYVTIGFPVMIIVLAFLPIVLCAAGFISINRLGGYVIIDKEKQIISRRGRLFGFKYSVKFCDIENVVIVQNAKLKEYIVIVDKAHINSTVACNEMIIAERKKSCIALENTEENMEFIRQIWEGPILPPRKFGDDNAFH
jgi:hypothetical protein